MTEGGTVCPSAEDEVRGGLEKSVAILHVTFGNAAILFGIDKMLAG